MDWNDSSSLDYGSDAPALHGDEQAMISTLIETYPELPSVEREEEQKEAPAGRDAEGEYARRRQRDEEALLSVTIESRFGLCDEAFDVVLCNRIDLLNRSGCKTQRYAEGTAAHKKAGKPHASDFIADTEIVARRALSGQPKLWNIFKKVVLENEGDGWDKLPRTTQDQIWRPVAAAYRSAGLFPVRRYFA